MLAWPGCFTWAPDRGAALERAASAVGGHLDWLAEHGEVLPLLESGRPHVVEEVPAERDGDYERNACFQADHRPVGPEELETLLRRSRWARQDLLATVGRARALPDDAALRGSQRSVARATAAALLKPRSVDEVLRHVGQAEVWFTSRLERGVRYDGPPADGDLDTYLKASRAWFEERIRDLQAHDPDAAATTARAKHGRSSRSCAASSITAWTTSRSWTAGWPSPRTGFRGLPGGAAAMWPSRIWRAC